MALDEKKGEEGDSSPRDSSENDISTQNPDLEKGNNVDVETETLTLDNDLVSLGILRPHSILTF